MKLMTTITMMVESFKEDRALQFLRNQRTFCSSTWKPDRWRSFESDMPPSGCRIKSPQMYLKSGEYVNNTARITAAAASVGASKVT